jgi:hypothetical protein
MERESPAPAATQIETLHQENARLRAQLAAMQQLALAPREPMGRSIQVLLVLFGMAAGAAYMKYSDAGFMRDARAGYNDAMRR